MTWRNQYRENGYIILKGAASEGGVHEAMADIESIFSNNVRSYDPNYIGNLHETMAKLLHENIRSYISCLSLCAKLLSVQCLFNIKSLLQEASIPVPTAPTHPVINTMSKRLYVFDGYNGTVAHQDWPSLQGSLDMVTAWIPLTDARSGNFPLEITPKSHLGGLLPGHENGSVLEVEYNPKKFIPIEASVGDIILMSGFTIHRTGQGGDGLRMAASMRFDNASEKEFIKRGYPCAQKRVVNRGIITEGFPTVGQVRGAFQS